MEALIKQFSHKHLDEWENILDKKSRKCNRNNSVTTKYYKTNPA